MLYIESLEIEDHILDKIESKHGVTIEEVEEAVLQLAVMFEEVRKGFISSSGRRRPGAMFWWCWWTWVAASGG